MKYLSKFNRQLSQLREDKHLALDDVSDLCQVDVNTVKAWGHEQEELRCYPTIDNLIDLCLKTGTPLEYFLELSGAGDEQLELPGLAFIEEHDVNLSLDQLQKEIEKTMPSDDELELLKRYRNSDDESQKLILQLMV